MNKITTEILQKLLSHAEYWDRKSGKILRDKVTHSLLMGREALWFDRIYFPIVSRLSRVYKNHNIPCRWIDEDGKEVVTPIEWYEETVLCNGEELSLWRPKDEMLMDWFDNRINSLMECIWYNHPDWLYEEPTEEEMLALGVTPGNIAAQELLITGVEKVTKSKDVLPVPPKPKKYKPTEGTQGTLF